MNAHEFVAEHGIEEAKRVLEGAPSKAQRYFLGKYLKQGEWTWWWSGYVNKWLQYEKHIYSDSKFEIAVDLLELKQVVESVEIVEQLGELNSVKKKLYGKHIGYTHFSVGANGRWAFLDHYVDFIPDSAYHIGLINKHIADCELVESYKQVKVEVLDMVDVSPRCEVINETH